MTRIVAPILVFRQFAPCRTRESKRRLMQCDSAEDDPQHRLSVVLRLTGSVSREAGLPENSELTTPCSLSRSREDAPGRGRPASLWTACVSSGRGDAGKPARKRISPVTKTASTTSSDRRLSDDTHQHGMFQHLPHISEALKRTNVTCVQVKYNGLFDCGVVEDPVYLTSNAAQYDGCIPLALGIELHAFFTELLELRFPGWDNAEGARGEFQWDLNADLLAHAHLVRCVAYKSSVRTGL